jgi:hypothetical protein
MHAWNAVELHAGNWERVSQALTGAYTIALFFTDEKSAKSPAIANQFPASETKAPFSINQVALAVNRVLKRTGHAGTRTAGGSGEAALQ